MKGFCYLLCSNGYEEITFGNLQTFATINLPYQASVYVLQEDIHNSGWFLAGLENSLVSFSPNGSLTVLAGSTNVTGYLDGQALQARFTAVLGIFQTQDRRVIISDHSNHCLRILNRDSRIVSTFSGNCTYPGYLDSKLEDAMFSLPTDLEPMEATGNRIAVVEFSPKRVRYIHMQERLVSTAADLLTQVTHLLKTPHHLYLAAKYGVQEAVDEAMIWISGSYVSGSVNGNLKEASFMDPQGLAAIGSSIILLADRRLNKLRILNIDNESVTSICSGKQGYLDADLSSCQLTYPYSLLVKNQTLYIGESSFSGGGIRQINFQGEQLSTILVYRF